MKKLQKIEILTKEYTTIINMHDRYDRYAILINGWAFTLLLGSVGFLYAYPEVKSIIYMLGYLGLIIFWYLETKCKLLQSYLKQRIKAIESSTKGDGGIVISPLQFHAKSYKDRSSKGFWEIAFKHAIFNPYLYAIIGIFLFYIYAQIIEHCSC